MGLNIIVTVKQVPDTHNVSGEAMKPDGTVNRAALPAIFNPEDLNALEEALKIKETVGANVTVISMGPPKAVDIIKECLYRGADDGILVSDRRFAGADTLATSYALSCAIKTVGKYDMILCGRQAIDGDTAQVGPQIAEKLKLNQITGVFQIDAVGEDTITARRHITNGYEIVMATLPVLISVTGDANEPRSPSAKRVMMYKKIEDKLCEDDYDAAYLQPDTCGMISHITKWNVESIGADDAACGLSGSPTKVKSIENVVLTAKDVKQIPPTDDGIAELIAELTHDHIIG